MEIMYLEIVTETIELSLLCSEPAPLTCCVGLEQSKFALNTFP